jgi:hypothetical protein
MRLVVAAASLFVLLSATLVSSQDKTKTANPQHDSASQQTQQPTPSTTIEVNVGYPRERDESQPAKQDTKKERAPFMSNFEWVISIVTTVYSVFSVLTFFAINKQTAAHVASESPWIMVDIEYSPGMHGPFLGTSSGKDIDGIQHHTDFMLRFVCSNHGKTPALITEKAAKLVMFPKGKLPNNPDLSSLEILDNRVEPLAAREKSTRQNDQYLSVPGYRGLDQWIVLYGVVKFRDIFGRDRQTTFGYEVTLGDKIDRLPGYAKYNENT